MQMSDLVVSPEVPRVITALAWTITLFVFVMLVIELRRRFRPASIVFLELRHMAEPRTLVARERGAIAVRFPGDAVAKRSPAEASMAMNLDLVFSLPDGLYRERVELEIQMPRELAPYFRGAMIGHGV